MAFAGSILIHLRDQFLALERIADLVREKVIEGISDLRDESDHANPTRIVLVRHGVTDFTVGARLDGRGGSDPSLNAAGQDQAAAAGRATAHLLGGSPARVVTPTGTSRTSVTGTARASPIWSATSRTS